MQQRVMPALQSRASAIHRRLWMRVRPLWQPNAVYGHGADHARRTYRHTMALAADNGADALVAGAAALLIDAGLDLFNGRGNHIARSQTIAHEMCAHEPELHEQLDRILDAIASHEAETPTGPVSPIESIVVRDADTLDRMGLTGVRMTILYGQWVGRPLHHPKDPFCLEREPELDGYTFDYLRYLFGFERHLATNMARWHGAMKTAELACFFDAAASARVGSLDAAGALALVRRLRSRQ